MNRSVEFPVPGPLCALPSPPLRDFVSHYWLCRDAHSTVHAILPDGAFIQDATRPPDDAAGSFNHSMGHPK
ncbi:MAG: hypothetical protein ACLGH6_14045 [Gammaproteobacteria bacterium]